jgi:enoyl-CoA hydratase
VSDEYVLCERDANGVALVRLNRPPMNPLSQAMLAALRDVASDLAGDTGVKAVVIAGSDKAFAAGADIDEFGDQDAAARIGQGFRAAFDAVESIPRPVIAAIRGYALGGGLELAMACDLRVAADNSRVGQPEILLGIIPGAGGTVRLPRLVGPGRAKEMIFSGRQVRAEEAHGIGLVDKVVPSDEVEHTALHWASEFAKGAVVAMGLAKRAIHAGTLDDEASAFVEVFGTEDARTGVEAFREHGPGKAHFSGR